MKKISFHNILFLLAVVLFSSCEKVIDVDLNSKDPKLVIEGHIDDQPGPYFIRLSTTVNFDEPNEFPGVSGATVIIKDDQGGIDTLTPDLPGVYRTNTTQGLYGHTYTLEVYHNNDFYTATEKMPAVVPFDSLRVDSISFFGQQTIIFIPYYNDPIEVGNRYRFIVNRNSDFIKDPIVFEDRFNNGLMNSRPIFVNEEWESGDFAIVVKQDITQGIYDYFNSLQLSTDGQTASPANPISNIKGGALGYFSVHTVQAKSVVIP
jgi:hypothetical protein